jgi:hypothetical protein
VIGLVDLKGHWRLTRRIEDARAGLTGDLQGTCRWLPDGDGLRQEEEGVLRYGHAPPMQAARVYLWRETPEGLAVFFEDGRPFHRLIASHLSDRHWCALDIYDVSYDFTGWPDWTQVWRVSGPRKDTVITSRFQPLG